MLNRTIAPAQHEIDSINLVTPQEHAFENGLKLFVFESAAIDLVKIEFIFNNIFPEGQTALLNTCLSSMLKEGTKTRSGAQIADDIDFYGAYLVPEYTYDQTAVTVYTMTKHLSAVLDIVHDVIKEPTFPEVELETFKRNNKQRLQISLQKNDFVARKMFYNALFGATRYGETPTEEAYDSLSREQLVSLYAKQIQPQNCTVIMSGNVSEADIKQVKELFVDTWPLDEAMQEQYAPMFPVFEGDMLVEERADSLQSAIRLGMPMINRTHADFPALQFVNTLFGGYFGSRLMRNIREEKGYTYSIGSAVASLKYGGFFTVASEVGTDVTQATLDEIEKEFNLLRTELAPQAEIDLVKNYILGSIMGSLESIFSHADKFKAVHFYSMTTAYYDYYNEVIRSMTAEKVMEIANKYFDFNKLSRVVVGKMD